jgi:hypothetical protein
MVMAWAMAMASSFGEFFPDGDYPGWFERLHKYFVEKMPAEKKAGLPSTQDYLLYITEKFHNEIGNADWNGLPPISAIEAHEPPEVFETEKRYVSLGSLVKLTARIVAVDEDLKKIIEKLEPDNHQFFPIKIVMPKGEVYPKQYYTLGVGQYLDNFSLVKSKQEGLEKNGDRGKYRIFTQTKPYISGIAVTKALIGGAHLWRELHIDKDLLFFSDALQAEIAKAGLHVPKHFQVLEV